MTPISLMHHHRSIRKFTPEPISAEWLNQIISAGQCASTSSFMQTTSLIRVTDRALREQLVTLTGDQRYVGTAAEFFVICADYQRHASIVPEAQLGFTEQLLTVAIDAGLFAQNMLLAAESLGLGGVFIGAIRNHPKEVVALLQLPSNVFPLFGLCLGWPAQDPAPKPRLPHSVIVHENHYHTLDQAALNRYDADIRAYYEQRTGETPGHSWSESIAKTLHKEARPFMVECLQQQNFAKR